MAGPVFLTAVGRGVFVVLSLDVGVCDRVGFLEVAKQLANQKGLAREFHLYLVLFGRIKALFLGLLDEDFPGDHLVAQLPLHLGRDRTTRPRHLLG